MKKSSFVWFTIIVFVCVLLFKNSFFAFYTNDDFYHLKISRVNDLDGFVNFFNLKEGSEGQLLYRPLTTHVFYFLGWSLFNLDHFKLHIFNFLLFVGILFFIYKITIKLTKKESLSLITVFLYATSATHFAHLYYFAGENVLGFFFFSTVYIFIQFLYKPNLINLVGTLIMFSFSMMSKENSVTLPVIFGLVYLYLYKIKREINLKPKMLLKLLIPVIVLLTGYFYMRFKYYGFVAGDSYIWDFSPIRTLNTLFWYLAWSINVPEMFVDFVGPGFKLNPNLLRYWGGQVKPILSIFLAQTALLFIFSLKSRLMTKKHLPHLIFSLLWFVTTLSPVLFLPLHKFSFYLTLPLFGLVYGLSYMFSILDKKIVTGVFLVLWIVGSYLCLKLTVETNWITNGQAAAKRVYEYVESNKSELSGKTIVFIDTPDDSKLPFSPTITLKSVLSDNNFFNVFYPNAIKAVYNEKIDRENYIVVHSRMFVGY